jgi:hypothetical protein
LEAVVDVPADSLLAGLDLAQDARFRFSESSALQPGQGFRSRIWALQTPQLMPQDAISVEFVSLAVTMSAASI